MRYRMKHTIDLHEIDTKIQAIKKMAEDLSQMADDFPSLAKSTARILANVKMLELNVSDICQIGDAEINK
jgi:hypothetical protein